MAEAERITIHIGTVDVGKMDPLIDEGVYAARTDFLRDHSKAIEPTEDENR